MSSGVVRQKGPVHAADQVYVWDYVGEYGDVCNKANVYGDDSDYVELGEGVDPGDHPAVIRELQGQGAARPERLETPNGGPLDDTGAAASTDGPGQVDLTAGPGGARRDDVAPSAVEPETAAPTLEVRAAEAACAANLDAVDPAGDAGLDRLLLLSLAIFAPISRLTVFAAWWIDKKWEIGTHYGLFFDAWEQALLNQVVYGAIIQIIPGFVLGAITLAIMRRRKDMTRE